MIHKSTDNVRQIALFPGTFDPFTKGHLSILERFLPIFGKVIVAVGYNLSKPSAEESAYARVEEIKRATSHLENVEVISYNGLTTDIAKEKGAGYIIKGVRDVADYEYERRMADINREISGIETIIMFSLPEFSSISSSIVRELRHYGEDVKKFLP